MSASRGCGTFVALMRNVLPYALLAVAQMARAQASMNAELNDVWAAAGEPGWGMQIVEQGDIAFTTLFVNDATGRPTFYTSFLSPDTGNVWSGDLFETKGPYFGSSSYDTSLFGVRRVGSLKFTKTTSSTAALAAAPRAAARTARSSSAPATCAGA